MKKVFCFLFCWIVFSMHAQTVSLRSEAYTGLIAYGYDIFPYKLGHPLGFRTQIGIGRSFSVTPSVGISHFQFHGSSKDIEFLVGTGFKYAFNLNRFQTVALTIESGFEWVFNDSEFKFPNFLGLDIRLSPDMFWVNRIGFPAVFNSEFLDLYEFINYRFETGISVYLFTDNNKREGHKPQ
ncbi:MAG: hypothetical protein MI810_15530 [Flavobacteriales bacterium]|nr:hypothetical protein [Flavobacteriales bacterium]